MAAPARVVVALVAAGVVFAALRFATGPGRGDSPSSTPLAVPASERSPVAEAAGREDSDARAPREADDVAATPAIVLPDGARIPALNGVREDFYLDWPDVVPFSPIAGRESTPDGVEWYRHENGMWSTVYYARMRRGDQVTVEPVSQIVQRRPATAATR